MHRPTMKLMSYILLTFGISYCLLCVMHELRLHKYEHNSKRDFSCLRLVVKIIIIIHSFYRAMCQQIQLKQ